MYCPSCHHESAAKRDQCKQCGASLLLKGRYQLLKRVGHGASGQTWRANDTNQNEIVAIKELSFRKISELKELELFEREADALSKIDHPNIPKFFEHFVVQEDRFVSAYIVQEFVEGRTLNASSFSSEDQVIELLLKVANILDDLHDMKPPIIHRDIKPSNIIQTPDGNFTLIDFGSIRAAAQSSLGGSTVAGTLGYMAPEQLLGKACDASDFYGLGATAVALLAGKSADQVFDLAEPDAWKDEIDVSKELRNTLEGLLQPKAAERTDRSAKVLEDLEQTTFTNAVEFVKEIAQGITEESDAESEPVRDSNRDATERGVPWIAVVPIGLLSLGVSLVFLFQKLDIPFRFFGWAEVPVIFSSVLFGYVIATLVASGFAHFFKRFPHAIATAAIGAPLGVLMYVGGLDWETESAVYGTDGSEIRRMVFQKVWGHCQFTTFALPEKNQIKRHIFETKGYGCGKIRQTDSGTVWVETRFDYQLIDLWNGQLIYNSSSDLDREFRFETLIKTGQIKVRLGDGTRRVLGPVVSNDSREIMKWVTPNSAVRSSDLEKPKGFLHTTFTRDQGCGALNTHRTTEFGDGEWVLARIDPTPSWQVGIQSEFGAEKIDGVFVSKNHCWVRAGGNLFQLDAETGKSSMLDF